MFVPNSSSVNNARLITAVRFDGLLEIAPLSAGVKLGVRQKLPAHFPEFSVYELRMDLGDSLSFCCGVLKLFLLVFATI